MGTMIVIVKGLFPLGPDMSADAAWGLTWLAWIFRTAVCAYIAIIMTWAGLLKITDKHAVIFDTIMWYTPPIAAWDDEWKVNLTSNMYKSCVSGTMGFPLYAEY